MVPVIVSEGYNKGRLSLSRLVEVLSTNPAVWALSKERVPDAWK